MKTAIRWIAFLLLLCSVPVLAEEPREVERRIVDHRTPIFVDGVQYERSELEQLKGQPMFWVLEKEASYGFTTPEGVQAFGRERGSLEREDGVKSVTDALITGPNCAGFNKNVGCGGRDWLPLCTPNTIPYISDSWNDVISCVETGPSVGKYTVLYKCYYFSAVYPNCYHIIWIPPATTVPDLNPYEMNNITSSIRFCSNVDPYSCT